MANNEKATINKMQLPNEFWVFNFKLANSQLFPQKLLPALHDNDITVM